MDSGKSNWQNFLKKISKDVHIAESSLCHDDEENQKERRDQMKAREEYFSKTQRRLQSFKSGLEGIKERLEDICHNRVGAEVIQPMLEVFERKLTDFKLVMRDDFVDLENEENNLTRDVQLAAGRFADWLVANDDFTKASAADRLATSKRKALSDKRFQLELDRQGKIGSIDKQLVSMGGRTRGWDHRDQDAFIRAWTQIGCCPIVPIIDDNSTVNNIDDGERSSEQKYEDDVNKESYEVDDREDGVDSNEGALFNIRSEGEKNEKKRNKTKYERDEMKSERGMINETKVAAITFTLPRNQFSSLLRRLPVAVPGKSLDELEDHINWYLKFLSLASEKKKLLLKWKEEKLSLERVNELAIARLVAADTSRGERRADLSIDDILREATAEIEERANARLKVSRWREQKDKDKEQKMLQAKDNISHENKLRDDETKRRQQLSRVQLEEWRETEAESQLALKRAGEEAAALSRRAMSVDPAEAKRRQDRDIESTKHRIERKEEYKKQTRPRSQIISELSAGTEFTANAKRDPNRLIAPTKASSAQALSGEHLDQAERKRATIGAHSSNIAMSGRDLKFSGRAVPVWRKPPM